MDPARDDPRSPADDSLVRAIRAQEPGAVDALDALLRDRLVREALDFLGPDTRDADDVAQTTIIAVLDYVRRESGFAGDVVKLAVTIARNRCRDLYRARRHRHGPDLDAVADVVADDRRSVLDDLSDSQRDALLWQAADGLAEPCRTLIRRLFRDGVLARDLRGFLGVSTVQAVYYRKMFCLRELRKRFHDLTVDRSPHGDRSGELRGRRRS
jgi:DNA-directed RNA polymerase specialized sigma24 family protein